MSTGTPAREWGYVGEVVHRLSRRLDGELQATYLIGSLALGDYVPDASDIDVLAVCKRELPIEKRRAIVQALSHPALECPARGLEFVLYDRLSAAAPGPSPRFQINLNTGPRMEQHVSFEPSSEPGHWFVLDIAIARQRAIPVMGPPASEAFGPIPRERILGSLAESLDWHTEHESLTHFTVLNACRAWRFAEEGLWDSKTGAGAWARARLDDPWVVDSALAVREGGGMRSLDADRVRALVRTVRARLEL